VSPYTVVLVREPRVEAGLGRDPLDVGRDLVAALERHGAPVVVDPARHEPRIHDAALDSAVGDHRAAAFRVEGVERHRRVRLEAEQLAPPPRPGGELVGACP
jgi:hypothetical protein